MTEENILQEIAEIRQSMTKGETDYKLRYSVKCQKSFQSVTLEKIMPFLSIRNVHDKLEAETHQSL